MFPEFSMFCKIISLHVSMQHVKSSSNLDWGYVILKTRRALCYNKKCRKLKIVFEKVLKKVSIGFRIISRESAFFARKTLCSC